MKLKVEDLKNSDLLRMDSSNDMDEDKDPPQEIDNDVTQSPTALEIDESAEASNLQSSHTHQLCSAPPPTPLPLSGSQALGGLASHQPPSAGNTQPAPGHPYLCLRLQFTPLHQPQRSGLTSTPICWQHLASPWCTPTSASTCKLPPWYILTPAPALGQASHQPPSAGKTQPTLSDAPLPTPPALVVQVIQEDLQSWQQPLHMPLPPSTMEVQTQQQQPQAQPMGAMQTPPKSRSPPSAREMRALLTTSDMAVAVSTIPPIRLKPQPQPVLTANNNTQAQGVPSFVQKIKVNGCTFHAIPGEYNQKKANTAASKQNIPPV
ncbi:hypothetical protein V8E53_002094 [Lactarius tabidus]